MLFYVREAAQSMFKFETAMMMKKTAWMMDESAFIF